MIHPSYTELIDVLSGQESLDNSMLSRYTIIIAAAKRARQLIAGEDAYVNSRGKKPLSIAVEEIEKGFVTIEPESKEEEEPAAVEVKAEETAEN